ncbi:MAG: hypothetical protein ACI8RZ_007995 [Myxococcota bacterium]|jgi:hypothetical protein
MSAAALIDFISIEKAAEIIGGNRQSARNYIKRHPTLVRLVNGRRRVLLADLAELDDRNTPAPAVKATLVCLPSDDELAP